MAIGLNMIKGVGVIFRAALNTLFTSLQRYEWNGFSRKGFQEHKGIPFPWRPSGEGQTSLELGLFLKSISSGIFLSTY